MGSSNRAEGLGDPEESPEASVAKSLRLATTEVLSDVGKESAGDIEAGNPDWANALRERIPGENPSGHECQRGGQGCRRGHKAQERRFLCGVGASAPDVDEATHEQWDRVTGDPGQGLGSG